MNAIKIIKTHFSDNLLILLGGGFLRLYIDAIFGVFTDHTT